AAHVFRDLRFRARVPFANARDGGHDLAGGAVAALERIVLDERGLHRMERAALAGETFDRRDLPPLGHDGEHEAGQRTLAVDVHGARAAFAAVATLLRAGEAEPLAQRVEQRGARIEIEAMLL